MKCIMNKRLPFLLIAVSLLITGCSSKSDSFLTYRQNKDLAKSGILNIGNIENAGLFAQNLCVIPSGEDNFKDGNLTGLSTLLINSTKNEVVYADNIYQKLYPASITKLATALVALKYADLKDTVTVSKNAANIKESGAKLCGLKEGDKIVLKDLLTALLVYSGNDAGIAIAEHISGTEEKFADLMNEEVKKLGAVNSHFINSHGLHDDDHYTTAYDLYLIFHELLNYSDFLDIIKMDKYKMRYLDKSGNTKEKTFPSTDRFLNGEAKVPEGLAVLGGKTGTTYKAGSCLILATKDKSGDVYISLILKADSSDALFSQMTYLLKLISR